MLPLEEVERRYVRRALRQLGGDKRKPARRLGMS
jgi:DNA-binding NtrC family response regulator